jgi:hypothetical protein
VASPQAESSRAAAGELLRRADNTAAERYGAQPTFPAGSTGEPSRGVTSRCPQRSSESISLERTSAICQRGGSGDRQRASRRHQTGRFGSSIDAASQEPAAQPAAGPNLTVAPIFQFDTSGKLLKGFGAGMFVSPHKLTVDKDGNLGCRQRQPSGLQTPAWMEKC